MTSLIIINLILFVTICWVMVKSHMTISELGEELHDANMEVADKIETIAELKYLNRLARERNDILQKQLREAEKKIADFSTSKQTVNHA